MRIFSAAFLAGIALLTGCHGGPRPVAQLPQPPVDSTPAGSPGITGSTITGTAPTAEPPHKIAETRTAGISDSERHRLQEHLARLNDALFDYDKATIRDDARAALDADVKVIRDILHDYPSQKLIIEGHCDERGSEEYNMALGDRRAAAAKEFLVSMGVAPVQLNVISYGKDRPACTVATEDCWQKNRRARVTAAP